MDGSVLAVFSCLSKQSGDVKNDDVTSGLMSPGRNIPKIRLSAGMSFNSVKEMFESKPPILFKVSLTLIVSTTFIFHGFR